MSAAPPPQFAPRPERGGRFRRLAVVGAVAALYVATLTPSAPWFVHEDLDASFAATLSVQAERRAIAGVETVSTFGPLGFVYYDCYMPATYPALVALRGGLAGITAVTLSWIGLAATGALWGGAVLPLVALPLLTWVDAWLITLVATALFVELVAEHGRAPLPLQLLLGVAIGIATLVKVTFLISAAVVLGPLLAADLLGRHRVSRVVPTAVLTAAAGWLLCGQSLDNVVPFLSRSVVDVSGGYSRAMQMWPNVPVFLHTLVAGAAIYLAALATLWRRFRRGALLLQLSVAALLFLLFKAGFVRALDHMFITGMSFTVLALLVSAACWSCGGRTVGAAGAAALALALSSYGHAVAVTTTQNALAPLAGGWRQLRSAAQLPFRDYRGEHEQHLAAVRARNPLPALARPTDVYPHDQGVVFAYGLDYRPRPVFQSYLAYTGRLAELNRAFVAGPDAAETLLFRVATVDSRYPSLDDGLSWPEIMARYRPVARYGKYLHLERRDEAATWSLEPIATVVAELGEPVTVPDPGDGPLWARIDVRERAVQKIMALLAQAALVVLDVDMVSGGTRRYRLVPDLARHGFVLSPLTDTTLGFVRLAAGVEDPIGISRVRTMRVGVEPKRFAATFEPQVAIEFQRLRVPRWEITHLEIADPETSGLSALLRGVEDPAPLGGATLIAVDDGRDAVNAHAPAHFRIPLGPGSRALRIGFGIRNQVIGCTNGIVLRVSGRRRDGAETALVERVLDPRRREADRGPQEAAAAWPPGAYSELHVAVLDNGAIDCDWAYIVSMQVE